MALGTSKAHLWDPLYASQDGKCALGISKPCQDRGGELPSRYNSHLDRVVKGKDGGGYTLDNCRLICIQCDWQQEGNAPSSPYPELAAEYRTFSMLQDKAGGLRRTLMALSGDVAGVTKSPYMTVFEVEVLTESAAYFEGLEKETLGRMHKVLRTIPFFRMLSYYNAPGIGDKTAAHLISHIDIRRSRSISAIWRYFGYDPSEKYNPGKGADLKAPLYAALSITLLRFDSPYRAVYDRAKQKYTDEPRAGGKKVNRKTGEIEEYSKSPHRLALRAVVKVWLSHFWLTWRTFEGLSTESPWILKDPQHTHFYAPEDFGWPSAEDIAKWKAKNLGGEEDMALAA